MSLPYSTYGETKGYRCKVCGRTFLKAQSLTAHMNSEHPGAEPPGIF